MQSIERALHRQGGAAFLRPSPAGLGAEILAEAERVDMFRLYGEVEGQVLVIAGTEPDPGADPDLMAAYRQGLRLDLESVASKHANVSVEFRDGGHGRLFQDPKDIASRIVSFLNQD